jgi:hypothetical protein
MENQGNTQPIVEKKTKWGQILAYIALFGIIIYLISQLWQAENKKNALTQKLEKQIQEQADKINALNTTVNNQAGLLKEYKPYQAVIRSAALRDSIYKLLPYKFGETVYVMPDSVKAVVNSVQISGNASEYSIKYWVRTAKGGYQAISISDLLKLDQ